MLRRFALLLCLALPLSVGCDGDPEVDGGMLPDGTIPPTDGGMMDGGGDPPGPVVTICPGDSIPSLASGVCEATAGDDNLLITGDILTPGEVFRGGQVLVGADGRIACVGCDCSGQAGASGATTVVCPDGVVSPGLINGHEHMGFNAAPPMFTEERYEHRQEWRTGIDPHTRITNGGSSNLASEQWAELRMVMSGNTSGNTQSGVGGVDGFLRNLDDDATEGLGPARIRYATFIFGENGGSRIPMAESCDYSDTPSDNDNEGIGAYTPHMSEGINAGARNEFLCSLDGGRDVIDANTAIIHGVGMLAPDIGVMASEGASLIWSPRTNIALYGDTARVTLYDNLGVLISLGTDWLRSGSMNMLRELQCADLLNRDYMDGYFSDEELWLMATRNAAIALAFDDAIGTLATGLQADIAIYDASTNADHRAVIAAEPEDVALVLRGGTVLYGEQAVVNVLDSGCDAIDVCGAPRAACVMREQGQSYSALRDANSSGYPLFFCDETPTNEPTCVPSRDAMGSLPSPEVMGSNRYTGMTSADDSDGDGIANASDNCPRIFNPIRPLDMGSQADFDGDGVGDECDPCPLNADTTTCTAVNPDDRDGDDVLDVDDNCPRDPNPDQLDGDGDGTGDVCDACPAIANPGGASCPGTIYDVKTGTIEMGGVAISQSVVTAVQERGFVMQVPTDHPDYDGAEFSGIFVFTGSAPTVSRGDTVDVDATISDFFGQTQLVDPTITASATSSAIPDPVVSTPETLHGGGADAEALESVLVSVEDVAVTDIAPPPTREMSSSEGEFEVDDSLRVDDTFFLIEPFVMVGENFASITGVVQYSNEAFKLYPRDADDYVAGAAQLASLEPSLSYTRVDADTDTTPTFPTPLTVHLTRAPAEDTVVAITGETGLVVANVTVSAGTTSAVVPVDGETVGTFTVTAMLGTDSLTADVRVLDAAEAPATITIAPTPVMIPSEGTQTFTVTLDIPAPSTGARVTLVDDLAGTLPDPAEVLFAADQLEATFDYTAPVGPDTGTTSGTITATLEGPDFDAVASIEVLPPRPGTLLINEVDYDQPGSDAAEYVELYNPGTTAVSLAGKQLVLVNQTGSQYRTVELSGAGSELAPGGFLVVRAPGLAVASGAMTVDFPGATDQIQNGESDGMLVYDSTAMTVLDVLGYEGSTTTTIGGASVTLASSLADNNTTPATLSRIPDGMDTDAESDFVMTSCLTPGAPNVDSATMSCP